MNISLYSQSFNLLDTVLGSYTSNGSGTMLFDVRDQTQSRGQKEKEQLSKSVERRLSAIIGGEAEGSVEELNPESYDVNIPLTARIPTN